MRVLQPVLPHELVTLPMRVVETVELPCSPERLFQSFEDAGDWSEWLGIEVEWHAPVSPDTSRTIRGSGLRALEQFTEWEHGVRMAFYFAETDSPYFRRFGEEWRVTDLGEGRCRLTWTVGAELAGVFRFITPLVRWGLRRSVLPKFPKLADRVREPAGAA